MATTTFLHRVRLKNYRSIGACDVTLGPLTFLVGPNGSGKSNLLDALRFVADALNQSLDHAMRDRGGINEVRRRSSGHPTNFGMRLGFRTEKASGHYAFEISAAANGAAVDDESTRILMTDFYQRLLAGETDKLKAFTDAKKALRAKYPDPFHWAPSSTSAAPSSADSP